MVTRNSTLNIKRYTMKNSNSALAMVAGAVVLALAVPAFAADPPKDDANKAIEKLVKAIENLDSTITRDKQTNADAVAQIQKDMEALRNQVRSMEDEVRGLRQQLSAPASVSKRIDM